jgi:hypothetical protein
VVLTSALSRRRVSGTLSGASPGGGGGWAAVMASTGLTTAWAVVRLVAQGTHHVRIERSITHGRTKGLAGGCDTAALTGGTDAAVPGALVEPTLQGEHCAPLRVAFLPGMREWDLAVDLGCRVIVVGVGGPTAGLTSEWDSHGEVHGLDLR